MAVSPQTLTVLQQEAAAPTVSFFLVREEDGTSKLTLEDSSGSLLREESTASPYILRPVSVI